MKSDVSTARLETHLLLQGAFIKQPPYAGRWAGQTGNSFSLAGYWHFPEHLVPSALLSPNTDLTEDFG